MDAIERCRACGARALTPAFSLELASGGALDYVLCDVERSPDACGLLQNARPMPEEREAPAPSALYRTVRSHLRAVATEALELLSGRDCAALDIGCDDGTLLSFYPRWVERFGVDRGPAVDTVGSWAWAARAAFPSADLDAAFGERRFDIVTLVSTLEEMDDPQAVLARIKTLLTPDGVLAIETLYAPMTLTRNAVEPLIAGRAAVYSLAALQRLLEAAGFRIFRGLLTDKEGGSIRVFACHSDVDAYDFEPWRDRLARLWDEEAAIGLALRAPYQAFEARVEAALEAYTELMVRAARRGERAWIVGADAVARELVARAGAGAAAVEAAIAPDEPAEGAALGRGGPPLACEAAARAAGPGIVIGPAALKRELLERWREAVAEGASLVFLTPEPHRVDASNFAAHFARALSDGGSGDVETLRTVLAAAGGPRLVAVNPERASA